MYNVVYGLESLCSNPVLSGPLGLLSNVASLTFAGKTAFRALRDAGLNVAALFGPEHGYFGLGMAGENVADDQIGQIPINSLYGKQNAPKAAQLSTIQTMLIDLQDTGTRWYTFIATVNYVMRACAHAHVPVIVLDRPNPQGGLVTEGHLAESSFYSMVAPAPMPIRYGLTIGEAALWLNDIAAPADRVDLEVIPLQGWQRAMLFSQTGRHWAAPSSNIPRPETSLLYTGTCLIEGTNLSEGRGTPLPFEQIGAPFIENPEHLADQLNLLAIPGVSFAPAWFIPGVNKHAGKRCGGVRIYVDNAEAIRGFALGLHLIITLRKHYQREVEWTQTGDKLWVDALAANRNLRTDIESGRPIEEIVEEADVQARQFQRETLNYRLYQ